MSGGPGAHGVRKAGPGDVDAVVRLVLGFRDWLGRTTPRPGPLRAAAAAALAGDDSEILLAGPDGDEPCGVCVLRYHTNLWGEGRPVCSLEDLFVEQTARRSGYGRQLLTAAVDAARARDCYRIELDVNSANSEALALYLSAGFSAHDTALGGDTLLVRRELPARDAAPHLDT